MESNLFGKNKFPTQAHGNLHELKFHPLGCPKEHSHAAHIHLWLHTMSHSQGWILNSLLYFQISIIFLQIFLHQ